MSSFSVVTTQIEGMSGRLGTISSDTADLCGRIGGHISAAANTSASGALDDLMGRWATTLPHFGLAGSQLQSSMRSAAATYVAADSDIANAAGASL
jgi:hypothetical protein